MTPASCRLNTEHGPRSTVHSIPFGDRLAFYFPRTSIQASIRSSSFFKRITNSAFSHLPSTVHCPTFEFQPMPSASNRLNTEHCTLNTEPCPTVRFVPQKQMPPDFIPIVLLHILLALLGEMICSSFVPQKQILLPSCFAVQFSSTKGMPCLSSKSLN